MRQPVPNRSFRRLLAALGLLLIAGLAWYGLRSWLPSGSERFYLLAPPLVIALFFALSTGAWQKFKTHLRLNLVAFGVLVVFAAGYLCLLTLSMGLSLTDGVLWKVARELAIASYFLLGFGLIVGLVLSALRALVHWLVKRAARSEDAPHGRVGTLLCQVLPSVLLVPIVMPYALASFYVHRIKLPNPVTPAALADRPFEDVSFETSDGLTLWGWFVPARQPSSRTLLICHGLGANRGNFLPYVDVGDALAANVFLFDFRGHGDSDGHTISFGWRERLDVQAAVSYLRTQRPAQCRQLVALGISMGASSLIQAAAEVEPPFDAVVIDSAFCCPVELTDMVLASFPPAVRPCLTGIGVPLASLECGSWLPDVQNAERIAHVRAPLLIIHAAGDRMIACQHARRLYEHAVEPKTLWITDSGDHSSALGGARSEYLEHVRELVEQASARKGSSPAESPAPALTEK